MAAHENLLAVAYHLTPPTRGTTTHPCPYQPPEISHMAHRRSR
jgi:hypothetical protein